MLNRIFEICVKKMIVLKNFLKVFDKSLVKAAIIDPCFQVFLYTERAVILVPKRFAF